jgi:hypothetical protein
MNTYIDTTEKYDCMECDNRAVTPVNGRCPHCGSTVLVLAEEPENRVDENLTIVEGVPEWAIWYLENPNESREELEPEEREALKEFEEDYSFECIVEGSEDSFNRFPAFGLPCSTVDVYVHERGKERWTEEDEEAANSELIDEVMGEEARLEELTSVPDMEKYHIEREVEGDGCTRTRAIYYVPRLKKVLYSNYRENVVNVDIEGHYLTDASNLKKLMLDISFNPGEKVGGEFELEGYGDRIPLYTETVMEEGEDEGFFDILVMDGTNGL